MQHSRPPSDMQVLVESRLLMKEKKLLVAQLESVSRRAKLLKNSLKSNRRRLLAIKIFGKLQEQKLRAAADETEQIRCNLRALAAHQNDDSVGRDTPSFSQKPSRTQPMRPLHDSMLRQLSGL